MPASKCTKDLYKAFLQASSVRYSGLALSEVSPTIDLSHDSISRWLKSKSISPSEVWGASKSLIDQEDDGFLIADDTILAKTHSKKIELVNRQYSGNAHRVILGIGLVNLLWHNAEKQESVPVDYRIYDKDTDGKTKNTHLCEMLALAKARGLKPKAVIMDAWYSSLKNLKAIRDHGWVWITTLRKNRRVNKGESLGKLDIPEEGLKIHLRGYGWVYVFKFVTKNGRIDYLTTNQEDPTREQMVAAMKTRWSIEVYHRELKQTCGIERCQARTARAQRNHIGMAIQVWLDKHKRRITEKITLYQQDWEVIKETIGQAMCIILSPT